jgi:hypothetical protein
VDPRASDPAYDTGMTIRELRMTPARWAFALSELMNLHIGVFLLSGYKANGAGSLAPEGEAGMTNSSKTRRNIAIFLAVLSLSALTMVWLFWHHPVKTLVATVGVLAALGISARLARSIEVENPAELDRGEQGV